ncbi:MAG: hypothetical protein AAFZ15_24170 [Bacteroidota bacterium]
MNEIPSKTGMSLFEAEKGKLAQVINEAHLKSKDYAGFTHFIKGDISGIQEFIFNVKSEKAAKTLKARSYFIEALSHICIQLISDALNGNIKTLYNGGGNFYLFVDEEINGALPKIRSAINKACQHSEFYVTLSVINEISAFKNFGEQVWQRIQEQSAKDKLTKFTNFLGVFDAYPVPMPQDWYRFTPAFRKANGAAVTDKGSMESRVTDSQMEVFGHTLSLSPLSSGKISYKHSIVNKIPIWEDTLIDQYDEALNRFYSGNEEDRPQKERSEVIEFSELASVMAKTRTGTGKLAVLKMDIDGLGSIFDEVKSVADAGSVSASFKWFYDYFMFRLQQQFFTWQKTQKDGTVKAVAEAFKDNIYTVFSGGDDCFLLGGWDAVFEFARKFHFEFAAFTAFLKTHIQALRNKNLTISAGLIVVDPQFPIVRFAKLAEEALEKSKSRTVKNVVKKNAITVFDQTLTWEEFENAATLSNQLRKLIQEKGESRAILERIKRSATGYEHLQRRALKGEVPAPQVSRLFYYLRNVKKENLDDMGIIMQRYANSLITAFQNHETVNPMTFPVGARWAEFLTRS